MQIVDMWKLPQKLVKENINDRTNSNSIYNENITEWGNNIPLCFIDSCLFDNKKATREVKFHFDNWRKKSYVWNNFFNNTTWNNYWLKRYFYEGRYNSNYLFNGYFKINKRDFIIAKGFIAELVDDQLDILFALTVNIKTKKHKKIYIDHRLIDTDRKYMGVRKFLYKYYNPHSLENRQAVLDAGVEIIHTASINEMLFIEKSFVMPKVKSISEARKIKQDFINYITQ